MRINQWNEVDEKKNEIHWVCTVCKAIKSAWIPFFPHSPNFFWLAVSLLLNKPKTAFNGAIPPKFVLVNAISLKRQHNERAHARANCSPVVLCLEELELILDAVTGVGGGELQRLTGLRGRLEKQSTDIPPSNPEMRSLTLDYSRSRPMSLKPVLGFATFAPERYGLASKEWIRLALRRQLATCTYVPALL